MPIPKKLLNAAIEEAAKAIGVEKWNAMSKGERWTAVLPYVKARLAKAAERHAKRPTYDRAIDLLANTPDANEAMDEEDPAEAFRAYGTVCLVADIFDKDPLDVAKAALKRRETLGIESRSTRKDIHGD